MRRPTLIALLAALMVMAMALGASAALAGEVTGDGKVLWYPGEINDGLKHHELHGESDCAFSGLEDWAMDSPQPDGQVYVEPGVTQNWGYWSNRPAPGHFLHPGNSCNPSG
jgi:hypothetical protein